MRAHFFCSITSSFSLRHWFYFTLGFLSSFVLCHFIMPNSKESHCSRPHTLGEISPVEKLISRIKLDGKKSKFFIGVMTAQKYIDERVVHIMNTWGKDAKDFLIFFTSYSSKSHPNLPIINLPTVDDSYPPQKKSFLMLKFIHDHFIDDFDWFIRADDDIFLNIDLLIQFIDQLDTSRPQFIGQMGLGKMGEFGHLGFSSEDNFCMGGPGILMNRDTLKGLAPNIKYCLKHLYSTHEDVEVGRCIRRFVGIKCTSSYEMQSLFYHNFTGEVIWSSHLKRILRKALTLHPVKTSLTMYQVYNHIMEKRHQLFRSEITAGHGKLQDLENRLDNDLEPKYSLVLNYSRHQPMLNVFLGSEPFSEKKFRCLDRESLIPWDFLSRYHYSAKSSNPQKAFSLHLIEALEDNLIEIVHNVNSVSHRRGRAVDYKNLYYGNYQFDPLIGSSFLLDLLMSYRQYRGRRFTLTVRKHAQLLQSFSPAKISLMKNENIGAIINIIVPLSGRLPQFKRFVQDFREAYSKDHNIKLLFVLFPDVSEVRNAYHECKKIIVLLSDAGLPIRYADLGGKFSRAAALQKGASLCDLKDLLFFVDIDIHFDWKIFTRIRLNTLKDRQIYFPIVFSEFGNLSNIKSVDHQTDKKFDSISMNSDHGHWRQFGYGTVAVFNSDLNKVKGLNTKIHGWGIEDVDFFNRFVADKTYSIFRAPDLGLVHIYHETECDVTLSQAQYDMCLGSKYSNLASTKEISKYLIKNKII